MKRSREDVSPSEGPKEGDASSVETNRKKGEAAGGAAGDVDRRYEPIFFTITVLFGATKAPNTTVIGRPNWSPRDHAPPSR